MNQPWLATSDWPVHALVVRKAPSRGIASIFFQSAKPPDARSGRRHSSRGRLRRRVHLLFAGAARRPSGVAATLWPSEAPWLVEAAAAARPVVRRGASPRRASSLATRRTGRSLVIAPHLRQSPTSNSSIADALGPCLARSRQTSAAFGAEGSALDAAGSARDMPPAPYSPPQPGAVSTSGGRPATAIARSPFDSPTPCRDRSIPTHNFRGIFSVPMHEHAPTSSCRIPRLQHEAAGGDDVVPHGAPAAARNGESGHTAGWRRRLGLAVFPDAPCIAQASRGRTSALRRERPVIPVPKCDS